MRARLVAGKYQVLVKDSQPGLFFIFQPKERVVRYTGMRALGNSLKGYFDASDNQRC